MTTFTSTLEINGSVQAQHVTDLTQITAFYQAAIDNNLPVALWHQPQNTIGYGVVDFSGAAQPTRIDFTERKPGFAFSPFVNPDGNETLFIKASVFLGEAGIEALPAAAEHPNTHADFMTQYQSLVTADSVTPSWRIPLKYVDTAIASQDTFCTLVNDAMTYINESGIKKIVASRVTEAPLPVNFNPVILFNALSEQYPHAFVSLVSVPGVGTWIGASPELLLSLKPSGLRTVALAGTQARPAGKSLESVRWGQKEIEEQALVSDYIRDFFHDIEVRSFSSEGPRTAPAGNVVHLQTSFTVQSNVSNLHHLANQILYRLHPTSAVCGMPKNEALSFILEKENYNRAFYSGFLGPVHLNGESRLYVNLRCMQLKARDALLYVGAGITADSDPEAEWEETVLKSKTLLSVL